MVRFLVPLLFFSLTASILAAEAPPLKLIQTIPLGGVKGRFDHFAIDTKGQRLFVAALGNNTLEVIDLAAGKRLQTVAGMSKPQGLAFVPAVNRIVVANGGEGSVKILDGTTYEVLHTIGGLEDADNLRVQLNGTGIWVGYGDGALGLFEANATRLTTSVRLSGHPESFQLDPTALHAFVNVPDAKQVCVIELKKREVAAKWNVEKFQANFPMALDASSHRLLLGCRNPPRLLVLDSDTGKSVTDLALSGDTDDLFYDARRKRVYVSCGEGFIDVIERSSADSYHAKARIPTRAGARTSFFSVELDRLYVAVPEHGGQAAELRIYQPD